MAGTAGQQRVNATQEGAPSSQDALQRLLTAHDTAEWHGLLIQALAEGDVEAWLVRLKDESQRYLSIDPRIALRLAEALIASADLATRANHRALGLMARGDALRNLGRFQESLALLDEAGEAFLSQQDEVGWARTRLGWIVSSHRMGRALEALPVAEHARDVLLRHHEGARAAGLDLNTALVCRELGLYERALDLYDRARRTYESLGEAGEVRAAWATANKAIVLTFLGDFHAALALHEEARSVFVRRGETLSMVREDMNIACVYAGQGRYTRALRLLGDALPAAERSGLEASAAWIALDMAECYLRLNCHAEALELAAEALDRFERLGTPTEAAKARVYCALAHVGLGSHERALTLLDESATVFEHAGLTTQLGGVALQRAELFLTDANWAAAGEEAARAHALFTAHGEIVRRAQAALARARACLGLSQWEAAVRWAGSVLTVAREQDVLGLEHEGHHVLAAAARGQGDAAGALAQYAAAAASIDRTQSALAIHLRSHFLTNKLAVYHEAIDCALRLGRADVAFAYLERAKSRSLADYLAGNVDVRLRLGGADRALAKQLAQLRAEHNWLSSQLYDAGLGRRGEDGRTGAETVALRDAVRHRETQIARLLERLALRHAEGLEGLLLPPTDEQLAPPPVDDRTLLLEYYFGEETAAVFVVTSDGLAVVPLEARPREIRRLLTRWQLNLDATARAMIAGESMEGLVRNARGVLLLLYRALLQPVTQHLAGRERLVIVPHGPSHSVPFHALYDGQRYLLERLEVSVCPSSGLFRLCARGRNPTDRGRSTALVVAYSDGGRLPHVLEEAGAVAALFPGDRYVEAQATRAALVRAAPHHGVLHLAAHGEARLDNPTFAHVKLADGQLGIVDVFNLDLRGALVTLSACETGRSVVRAGDELVGLGWGVFYAGAATLVQSLWRVDDGSTARLMEAFYRALRGGATKGGALRAAQRGLLAGGAAGGHPYVWAAFQLSGHNGLL